MNRKDVLVVIPAFNEERNISHVLTQVLAENWNVLVVNDGSTDGTVEACRQLGAKVLDLPINLGVGGALRAGFKYAIQNGFEAVVQLDADGQHPVHAIDDLLQSAINERAHLVIGSRFLSDATTMKVAKGRKAAMWILATTASRATNSKITDATSGFRIICQPLLLEFSNNFAYNYLGDTYEAILAAGRAGYVVREVPAPIGPRLVGESTASRSQAFLLTLRCGFVFLFHFHLRLRSNPATNHYGDL